MPPEQWKAQMASGSALNESQSFSPRGSLGHERRETEEGEEDAGRVWNPGWVWKLSVLLNGLDAEEVLGEAVL